MSVALKQAQEKLTARQVALKALLDEGRAGGTEFSYENIKSIQDPAAEMRKLTTELEAAGKERDDLKVADDADAHLKRLGEVDPAERPAIGDGNTPENGAIKSLGQHFIEWDGFKKFDPNTPSGELAVKMSLKALFSKPSNVATATSGYGPDSPRTPLMIDYAKRPIQLLDRIRQVPIDLETWKYMEWTTRTEPHLATTPAGFGDVVEGGIYVDVGFGAQERTVDVIKKGVFLEATEEQFADVPGVEDYISMSMPNVLAQAIDYDLINRAAVTGKPSGLLNRAGIGDIAKADDEAVLNLILRGCEYVEVTGRAMPDLVLMNPRDYYREMGRQDTTGRYIIANPLTAKTEFRPWGIMAIQCDALPAGTAIIGDFGMYSMIRDRQDVRTRYAPSFATIQTGLSAGDSGHNTMRPTGKVMVYSDVRLAWGWLRSAAFCKLTGLE